MLLLAACGGDVETTTATLQPSGTAIASINGEVITDGQFNQWLKRRGVKDLSKVSEANREIALDELTTLAMMAQEAEKRGIATQPDVINQLTLQKKSLLADKLLEQELQQRPISDADVAAEYQRRKADMSITQYRARHILVADEQTAQQIIDQLNQGADFATLASEFSTEASKEGGGNLGWFELREMVKPFADEVEQLATGTFSSQPLKTDLGWHIVKTEGNRLVPAPKLAEMQPQLRQLLRAQRIEQLIADLKARYPIVEK